MEDFIAVLDRDGNVLEEFLLLDVQASSPILWASSSERAAASSILNDVRVLKAEDADAYPDFAPGDIMVSTNAINAVAVIDGRSRRIKWLTSGTVIAQHSPRFAGDNRIHGVRQQRGHSHRRQRRIAHHEHPRCLTFA